MMNPSSNFLHNEEESEDSLLSTEVDNYEDSRIELKAMGHNLTSVLMNPRESMMENILDEFASDQSLPLEYMSPSLSPITGSQHGGSFGSSSSHSVASVSNSGNSIFAYFTGTSSSFHGSSTHSLSLSNTSMHSEYGEFGNNQLITSASLLQYKATEDLTELANLVGRMKKVFVEYQTAHNRLMQHHNSNQMNSLYEQQQGEGSTNTSSSNNNNNPLLGLNGQYKQVVRIVEEVLVCFRDVPDIFFKGEFNLSHADTFTAVLVPSTTDQPTHQQEKLTSYLDLVEIALLKQILARSPAFFRALDDIKRLQTQVSEAIEFLIALRLKLQNLDDSLALTALRIPQLNQRKLNEDGLFRKLLCMQRVVDSKRIIQTCLDSEDYLSSLHVLAETKTIFDSELREIVCMKDIGQQLDKYEALVGEVMSSKFISMAIQWGDLDENDDLNEGNDMYNDTSVHENENNGSKNGNNNKQSAAASAEISAKVEQCQQLLHSLYLSGRLRPALLEYKTRLSDSIRLVVRTCVFEYINASDPSFFYNDADSTVNSPSDTNEAGGGGSATPAEATADVPFEKQVKLMSNENFVSSLNMIYEQSLFTLKRAYEVHQFLEKTLTREETRETREKTRSTDSNDNGSNNVPTSNSLSAGSGDSNDVAAHAALFNNYVGLKYPQQHNYPSCQQLITLSKECATSSTELCQKLLQQLLSLRKESTVKLTAMKIKQFWGDSLLFLSSLEKLSGNTAYILRQHITVQSKAYLEHFHEANKGKLVNTLDSEKWVQVDVTPERQVEIDRLVSGRAFLPVNTSPTRVANASDSAGDSAASSTRNSPAPFLAGSTSKTAAPAVVPSSTGTAAGTTASGNNKKEIRAVAIEAQPFRVVWSALLLLEIVLTYCDLTSSFGPLAPEVVTKIVELFRLYDARSRHLVLGAGAIHSTARLKSISAKHIAITIQSNDFMRTILPHIRVILCTQLPNKHQLMLTELDRLSNEYSDHHQLLVGKFVTIVSDSVEAVVNKLLQIDWDRNYTGNCEYFEDILRNISALHRVLADILPQSQLQDIFHRIFSALSRKLPQHFDEIMPSTQTGRQRIIDEVNHLVNQFQRLRQIDCSTVLRGLEESFQKRYGK